MDQRGVCTFSGKYLSTNKIPLTYLTLKVFRVLFHQRNVFFLNAQLTFDYYYYFSLTQLQHFKSMDAER